MSEHQPKKDEGPEDHSNPEAWRRFKDTVNRMLRTRPKPHKHKDRRQVDKPDG